MYSLISRVSPFCVSANLFTRDEFQEYVHGYDPRAVFPQNTILNRIAICIDELQEKQRYGHFTKLSQRYKDQPFIGIQLDMWTDSLKHIAYACIVATTVCEPSALQLAKMKEEPPALIMRSDILHFAQFPYGKKTGENIKAWFLEAITKLKHSSIVGITPDGASDGQCALASIADLAEKVDTCHLHRLQRAVLFATGIAGAESKNLEAKSLLKQHSRAVQLSRQSTGVAKAIREAQFNAGVTEHQLMSTKAPNDTRWGGFYIQLHTNCTLKPVLQPVIDEYKRANRANTEAIIEEDDSTEQISRAAAPPGKSVPASAIGWTSEQWEDSLHLESVLKSC